MEAVIQNDPRYTAEADEREDRGSPIYEYRSNGKEERGHDAHGHIEAGECVSFEYAEKKLKTVISVYLQKSLCPAEALPE